MILDGGSKVNSLQVNVVEDGVAIRVQSDRLETILNAISDGHNVVETSKNMEFRVEFVEDGDWISADNDYYPKSQIDELYLMVSCFQLDLSKLISFSTSSSTASPLKEPWLKCSKCKESVTTVSECLMSTTSETEDSSPKRNRRFMGLTNSRSFEIYWIL